MINEGNKESNDADKDEGMAASVTVEEGSNSHTFVSYEEYCRAKRKRNEQFLAETLQVAKQLRQDTIQIASNRKKKKKKIVASSTSHTTDKSTPRRLTRSLNKRMHLRSGKEVHDQAAPTVLDTVQMDDESKEGIIFLVMANPIHQVYCRERILILICWMWIGYQKCIPFYLRSHMGKAILRKLYLKPTQNESCVRCGN